MEKFDIAMTVFLVMIFLFIFLPIIYMLSNPGDLNQLLDKEVIEAFKTTLLAGAVATLIALILEYQLAIFWQGMI